MYLYDVLVKSAEKALPLQRLDGSMPAGRNGPWNDLDTPVRNTSHWLITFLKVHEITGGQKFLDAADRALEYLTGPESLPGAGGFWCRSSPGKDQVNGLVGQGWVLEALAEAGKQLGRQEILSLAESVFLRFPFDPDAACWHVIDLYGTDDGLHRTFNQQVWFAAAGALISSGNQGEVGSRVLSFLDRLEENLKLFPSGLIRHKAAGFLSRSARSKARFLRAWFTKQGFRHTILERSTGYHSFNLAGFALLNSEFPDHAFWKCRKFRRALGYTRRDDFREQVMVNPYGAGYNPVGFELPFVYSAFNIQIKQQKIWVERQLKRCFDFDGWMMRRNTVDSETLSARIYEAARLDDMELNVGVKPGEMEQV